MEWLDALHSLAIDLMSKLSTFALESLRYEMEIARNKMGARAVFCRVASDRESTVAIVPDKGAVEPSDYDILVAHAQAISRTVESSAVETPGGQHAFSVNFASLAGTTDISLVAVEPEELLPEDLLMADELGRLIPWAALVAYPEMKSKEFLREAQAAPSPRAYLAGLVTELQADAGIIWGLDRNSDYGQRPHHPTMRAMEKWGVRSALDDVSVPKGRGLIGRLESTSPVQAVSFSSHSAYNPSLIETERWASCILGPLSGGGQLIGALAFYTKSGWTDETAAIRRVESVMIDCLPLLRRLRKIHEASARTHQMEGRLENLQIGVELLGFAHDLAGSAGDVFATAQQLAALVDAQQSRSPAMKAVIQDLTTGSQVVHKITRAMNRLADHRYEEVQDFDLSDAIRDVEMILRTIAPSLVPSLGGGNIIHGNPLDVQRIAINLVTNAKYWTSEDNYEIEISVGGAEHSPDYAELRVRDNGQGMTYQQTLRSTNLFYSTRRGGLGLGLFVVRRLAARLGGEVKIHTSPLAGTLVKVTIPLAATLRARKR